MATAIAKAGQVLYGWRTEWGGKAPAHVGRTVMKIRRDSVFISSVLFTIAFLSCIPPILGTALTGRHPNPALDPNLAEATRLIGDLGVASLAILFIGLTVTWTGYVKRVRWTWFDMFIILWS